MAARRCQIVGLLFRNSMKRTCGQSGGRNLTNFRPVNFESSQKKCFHTGKSGAQAKVQEVGQFEPIKIEGNYDTGQNIFIKAQKDITLPDLEFVFLKESGGTLPIKLFLK